MHSENEPDLYALAWALLACVLFLLGAEGLGVVMLGGIGVFKIVTWVRPDLFHVKRDGPPEEPRGGTRHPAGRW